MPSGRSGRRTTGWRLPPRRSPTPSHWCGELRSRRSRDTTPRWRLERWCARLAIPIRGSEPTPSRRSCGRARSGLSAAGGDPRPELEAGAVQALVRLQALEPTVVHGYLRRKVALAPRYAALLAALDDDGDPRLQLVAHALRHASRRHAEDALLAASPIWHGRAAEAVDVALENLHAPDPAQRANALEMLEVVGEPEVVRPLLEVWETHRLGPKEPHAALSELLGEPDRWLRACAAHAAPAQPQLRAAVEALASSDPDALVRTAAREALRREERVETLRGARRPPWGVRGRGGAPGTGRVRGRDGHHQVRAQDGLAHGPRRPLPSTGGASSGSSASAPRRAWPSCGSCATGCERSTPPSHSAVDEVAA